ncbi:hypothetical protein [Streptomyces sp. NPDC016845]|uniref:hypothetical protein n=1 Tax=Streptomyces sp. NPDC016845 TaxID=3364972 RepID=UPI00379D5FE1
MADEHDKWLDRDAAERLLSGEPLEAATENDVRRAERLRATFDALTVLPAGPDGELPGEDVALKAFREARAVSAVDAAVHEAGDSVVIAGRHEAGGRPRWARPARFGLAAALAACMVGGVGVAVGAGMLPSPFGGNGDPTPASSVSGGVTDPDERPLVSPPPRGKDKDKDEARPDGPATPDPSGSQGAGNGAGDAGNKDASRDPASDATDNDGKGDADAGGGKDGDRMSDRLHRRVTDACRRYRGGDLSADERQRLRSSAQEYGRNAADLGRFCDRVLDPSDGSSDADSPRDSDYYGGSDGSPNGSNGSNGMNGTNQSGGANGSGGPDGSYGLTGSHDHGGGQDNDEDDDSESDSGRGSHRVGGDRHDDDRDDRHDDGHGRSDRHDRGQKTYRETRSDLPESGPRKNLAHQV